MGLTDVQTRFLVGAVARDTVQACASLHQSAVMAYDVQDAFEEEETEAVVRGSSRQVQQ